MRQARQRKWRQLPGSVIRLGYEGQQRFTELMQKPTGPTDAMVSLGNLPDLAEEDTNESLMADGDE